MRHLFENSWRSLGSLCSQILLQVPRVISKTEIWYLGGVGEFGVPSPQVSTPASFSLLWLILVSDHRANQSKINYQGSVCDIKQSPESREVRVRFESRCSEARKSRTTQPSELGCPRKVLNAFWLRQHIFSFLLIV